jgi:Protein of unknown function (DUF1353)
MGAVPSPARIGEPSGFDGNVQVEQVGATTWKLTKELTYRASSEVFTAPAGMPTDFASVPRPFSWLIPRYGSYLPAAVIHDHLYRDEVPRGTISYRDADGVLRQAMRLLDVPFAMRWVIWAAVRWAGLFRHGGRRGWWRDAPLVIVWTVLALPVALPGAVVVTLCLLVAQIGEFLFWVPLKLFSHRKQVNSPRLSARL